MLRLLLPLALLNLLLSCQSSATSEQSSDADTTEVEEESNTPGMGVLAELHSEEQLASVNQLPEIKLPYVVNYSSNEGIDVDTMMFASWLQGDKTNPVIRKALGVIHTDSAQFILWLGKQSENADVWRAYITAVYEIEPNYSVELDAAEEYWDNCVKLIKEHYAVINQHLEVRSIFYADDKCLQGGARQIRQFQITANQLLPEKRAHLFTGIPISLPRVEIDALKPSTFKAYEDDAIPQSSYHYFFQSDPKVYESLKVKTIANVPTQLDSFMVLGVWRKTPDTLTNREDIQLSYLCPKPKKDGVNAIVGSAANITLRNAASLLSVNHLVIADRFLKVSVEFKAANDITVRSEYYIAPYDYSFVVLDDMSANELRLYRNYVFARHGYIFKDQDLGDYFKKFDWYKPAVKEVSQQELSADENDLIKYIQVLEQTIPG